MARKRSVNLNSDSAAPKADRRRRPKVIIPLNEDGSFDFSPVPEEQRDRLRAALEEAQPEPPPPIDPAIVGFAIQTLASIEAAIVAPKMGLTHDRAFACIVPPPPLAEQIAQAGARVLEKYSGGWSKYQDEIVLCALIITWQAQAFRNLRAAKDQAEPRPEPRPEPGPEPEQEPEVITESAGEW
jgi:hypothetical protein